jgi:hypothetical protein
MADVPPDDEGNNQPEEDNASEYEDGEFPFLKADHPLLARVQKALSEQLAGHNERVSLQLSEKQ